MNKLYVLYDSGCGLCRKCREWLERQPQFVHLELLPAQGAEAARLFPSLSRPGRPEELVVVSDAGGVYRGARAWLMCLWALHEGREWAGRLAHPALMPLARAAVHWVSQHRTGLSRWLGLAGASVSSPSGSLEEGGIVDTKLPVMVMLGV